MAAAFETERLTIRELAEDHFAQIFDAYASNPTYSALTEHGRCARARATAGRL